MGNNLIITNERTFLRSLTDADAAHLFPYRSDPRVARFQLWRPARIKDANHFIQKYQFNSELINNRWNQFAICLRATGELIGDCGVNLADDSAEIGFSLAPVFQGRGLAFEAVSAVVHYLFSGIGLQCIKACTDQGNLPSVKLLLRLGFEQVPGYADDSDLFFSLDNPNPRH